MGKALDKALQEPECAEVLLIRSASGDTTPFTRSSNELENAIYSAISGQLTDFTYNNEFANGDLEHQWCHAKLTNGVYPAINTNLEDYALTHSIMYNTDFGRNSATNVTASGKCASLATTELDDELVIEYALAISCLNGSLSSDLITRIFNIHNIFDVDSSNKHLLYLLALAEIHGIV